MSDSVEKPKHLKVVPYLFSPSYNEHIQWLKDVFGAQKLEMYHTKDETKVMHSTMIVKGCMAFGFISSSVILKLYGRRP